MSREGIEHIINETLRTVDGWVGDHGLELAHPKTETVVLTGKCAYRQPELYSGGLRISVMRVVKYLGVTLDSKLTFTWHIRAVSASAVALARVIDRLIPNIGGPSVVKRRHLATVVSSRLLYAAPMWVTRAFKYKVNGAVLNSALRQTALRAMRSYRTVPTAAAFFLAEMPPTDLVAIERETVRR